MELSYYKRFNCERGQLYSLSGATRQNLSNLIAVGSEDLRT
jgi:hypothetical protein